MTQRNTTQIKRAGLGLLVLGLFSGGSLVLSKRSGRELPAAVAEESQSAIWHQELEEAARALSCPVQGNPEHERLFVMETSELLQTWRERELVDPAQGLRSWRKVEQALRCAGPESAGEPTQQLELERERLSESMARQLRAWHAAYLRAERGERDADALRAVRAMLELVQAHSGDFRRTLERAERRLSKKVTS